MREVSKLAGIESVDDAIRADSEALSSELYNLRARLFPPSASKELRQFTSGEAASLMGISDAYLRQLSLGAEGPVPLQTPGGTQSYTPPHITALHAYLSLYTR